MRTICKLNLHLVNLIILFMVSQLFFACDKNNANNKDIEINEETQKLFFDVNEDITDIIKRRNDVNYEDIQSYIMDKYDNQVSTEIKDSMLCLTLPDGYRIDVDLYFNSAIDEKWDDLFEIDIEEIQNTRIQLGLDDDGIGTKASSCSSGYLTRSGSDHSNDILTNREVLIWAPIEEQAEQAEKTIEIINSELKKTYKEINLGHWWNKHIKKGKDCTPYTMKEFSKYGLVLLFAHGRKSDGGLLLPWSKNFNISDLPTTKEKMETEIRELNVRHTEITYGDNYWVLNAELLLDNECLPQSLGNSIIWATICNSHKEDSEVNIAFSYRRPALFIGCEGTAYAQGSLLYLEEFAKNYYVGIEGREAWKNMNIKRNDERLRENEKYQMFHFYGDRKIYVYDHAKASAKKAEQNKARVSVIFPSDHVTASVGTRSFSTRSPMHRNDNVGVSFKNVKTNKVIEYLLDEKNCTIEKKYEYKGLTHYILRLNTDDLEEGTYEYRTYNEIDGEKEYSDNSYEFTIKKGSFCPDDNHPHAIDLGLPSGNKWSCCLLGESEPSKGGGVYPWGYISPVDKSKYDANYVFGVDIVYYDYKYSGRVIWHGSTYYCADDSFVYLGDDISGTEYDAVYVSKDWGDGWVMPNLNDFQELVNNCAFEGSGLHKKIIGPNGNYIDAGPFDAWSSTLGPINSEFPKPYMCAYLFSPYEGKIMLELRNEAFQIWPVYKKPSGK